jgi:radical SAM superfamily enzyme YgiQ (UPF0313 family)
MGLHDVSAKSVLLVIMPLTWPKMPPIGIGYLQAFLSQKGIHADIADFNQSFYNISGRGLQKEWLVSCNANLEDTVLSLIRKNNVKAYQSALDKMLSYDVIGFSCFKSNYDTTLTLVEILKSKKNNLEIVLGGPEITRQYFKEEDTFPQKVTDKVDCLIVGEGELPLYRYLKGDAICERVILFEQLKDLTELRFPLYTGLDIASYPQKNTVPIQLSRGCVRRCNFCSERLLYKNFRMRTIKSVLDEIGYHKTHNNTRYFVFYDSLINADLRKCEELCDAIIERYGSISWEAQIAVRNDMPKTLFKKIKKSGCYNLFVGLESGSNRILKEMNKGFDTDDALTFFENLHSAGLFFGISIIVGYPGETEQDFQESLDFVLKHKDLIPQIAQINPYSYYDGTIANKDADYKINPDAMMRMEIFVREIKRHRFRHTNAFIGNLIEKNVKDYRS